MPLLRGFILAREGDAAIKVRHSHFPTDTSVKSAHTFHLRRTPTDPSPLRGAPVPPLYPVPIMANGVEWAFEIPIRPN
jgi:hypothetical protein